MRRKLYILDYVGLGGLEEVYRYMLEKCPQEISKYVKYIRFSAHISKVKYLRRAFTFSQMGLFNIIEHLILKNSIGIGDSFGFNFDKLYGEYIYINHGWGTKKTPGNNEIKFSEKVRAFRLMLILCNYIICLSDFDETYFLRHPLFDSLPRPKFLPLGLPRNDFLVKNKMNSFFRKTFIENFGVEEDNILILYAPTHRELQDYNIKTLNRIFNEFELIDKYLEDKKIIILFRPHYYISYLKEEIQKFRNIVYVGYDKFRDPRPLLLACDYLLTDYSSIFVDFLLLQKPVIFYPFDLEEYERLRGLVIDFSNKIHTPGPKINNLKDLLDLDTFNFKDFNLEASLHFFHKYEDGRSTERVANFLIEKLKEGK